jgi:hypothetical protein
MSLRDLVTFAQHEISRGELFERRDHPLPPLPIRDEPIPQYEGDSGRVPAQEDYDLPDEPAERPPVPDWLRNPENETLQIGAATSAIFTEGNFDAPAPITAPPGPVPAQGPDALAYYLPYHCYRDGIWGVYLRAKGILELASGLKGDPITHGADAAIEAARVTLIEHELFHCLTEAAATRAEIVARSAIYRPYSRDRYATFHEEAMANAYAHDKVRKAYPSFATRLEDWMKGQGPGYRDFHLYAGRSLRRGRLVCSQRILRFAPPRERVPRKLPAEFLFRSATGVPTYLVVDAEIASGVLRPFPKYKGIVVATHSNDHQPPHIHVEMSPGHKLTRCEWPSLEPLRGEPPLSNKERSRLCEYLKEYGAGVWERLRSVYKNPELPMPTF